jgi:DNA-binding CsgD family transcriptional regulator
LVRQFGASESSLAGALTQRQREVLRLAADGVPTHEIAARLSISEATVRRHLRISLARLASGVGHRSTAAAADAAVGAAKGSRSRSRDLRGPASGRRILARELQRAGERRWALSVLVVATDEGTGAGEGADLSRAVRGEPPGLPAPAYLGRVRRIDRMIPWVPHGYLVILPGSDLAGAVAVAERLRAGARGHDLAVGVAEWQLGESAEALLARAERASDMDRLRRDAARSLGRAIHAR